VLLRLVAVVAAAAWIGNSLLASAQPQERTILRRAPLSCAELIATLGLQGEEVHCKEPPPPATEQPRVHGPYRLVPAGYVGPLSYAYDEPPEIKAGVITNGIAVLQASSLYKPPSYTPEGYTLLSMDTFDGDSETIIRAVYSGPGDPIDVFRVRRYQTPIDVYLPPPDALRVIEATTLNGRPAILSYPEPGSILDGRSFTRVSFVDADIETTVMGHRLDLENAMRIARSLQ
jgi:hypothetical protein